MHASLFTGVLLRCSSIHAQRNPLLRQVVEHVTYCARARDRTHTHTHTPIIAPGLGGLILEDDGADGERTKEVVKFLHSHRDLTEANADE